MGRLSRKLAALSVFLFALSQEIRGQWSFHNTALLQNPFVLHYPLPGIRAPPPVGPFPWLWQQQQHQHHVSGAATDQVNNAISWGRRPPPPPPPRKSPSWWNWSPEGPKKQPSRPPWREKEKGPNLIEGDIAVDADEENQFRLGIRFDVYPEKRWSNNTIAFKISSEYDPREVSLIRSALKTFQFMSCLRFVDWDGRSEDYLYIHHSKERPGCWSYIGRRGGRQELSLRPPDGDGCHCLCDVGRPLHEMMHALGFYHEHTRPDRDDYITILRENVRKGKWGNFDKRTPETTSADFAYDYGSIMHYGPYFFSKSKKRKKTTILPKKPGTKIGQRSMLSKVDCMKLNQKFGCFKEGDTWHNEKIRVICGMMGFSF